MQVLIISQPDTAANIVFSSGTATVVMKVIGHGMDCGNGLGRMLLSIYRGCSACRLRLQAVMYLTQLNPPANHNNY